jgi:transposase-like protein
MSTIGSSGKSRRYTPAEKEQADATSPGQHSLAFLRDLVARGPSGVRLVTSDAHGA